MPVIIVEGCDNSGKTTLVNKLHRVNSGIVIRSLGPNTEDLTKAYLAKGIWVAKMAAYDGYLHLNVIFDRMPLISEEVYGRVLRGYSVFEDDWTHWWESMVGQLNPFLIYCRPNREVMHHTIKSRDQLEGVAERLDKLINSYDRFMGQSPWIDELVLQKKFTTYSYTEDPEAQQLIKKLVERGAISTHY